MKLFHILGFHNLLNSFPTEKYKLEYQNLFDVMVTWKMYAKLLEKL